MFRELPADIQVAARKAYRLWLSDPRHPSLHFKPVRSDIWSVRISRDYRALALVRAGATYWHWIGRHEEYQRRIAQSGT